MNWKELTISFLIAILIVFVGIGLGVLFVTYHYLVPFAVLGGLLWGITYFVYKIRTT